MKILLLGKNGQVGWELQRSLAPLGTLAAADRHAAGGDLARPSDVARLILSTRPDVVVNAAAYTAVDRAEEQPELARLINATAVGALAQACGEIGAWFVHYSTDYVFDGSGDQPWQETDAPGPLNTYGRTKLEGERAIAGGRCRYLLFRTGWVYAARGVNFPKTVLKLAAEQDELRIIDDQFGAPTSAELIADVTAHCLRQAMMDDGLAGTYHLAAAGSTTWYDYAGWVLAHGARLRAGALRIPAMVPVASTDFSTPAKRPLNSRLDTSRLQRRFGLCLPAWQDGLERMLAEILQ